MKLQTTLKQIETEFECDTLYDADTEDVQDNVIRTHRKRKSKPKLTTNSKLTDKLDVDNCSGGTRMIFLNN